MKQFLKTFIGLGIAFAVPSWAQAEAKISNFRMSLCSADQQKCIEIEGLEARQSVFAPIYSFKNSQVRLLNRSTGTVKVYSQVRGHFDFGSEQVVLIEKRNDGLFERTFPLATLEETKYLVK